MSLKIQVYSDYVCPYCYLSEFALALAARDRDVQVEWMPFELRPAPQPTLRPDEEYLQRTWLLSVYPMAKRLGAKIVLPRISPQPYTHLAFEGYQFAKERGKAGAYHQRVMRAFFTEEQDIGKIGVLTRLAGELGLEEKEFKQALESRRYHEAHQRALHHARIEAGIKSVPTFLIGGKRLVGMQTREALARAIGWGLEREKASQKGAQGVSKDEATL